MKTPRILILSALLALSCSTPTMAYDFNTVIVGGRPDGDPLRPELGAGIDWDDAAPLRWYMNASGQVAFMHALDDLVPETSDRGIWRWTGDGKNLLAREDGTITGLPAGVTVDFLDEGMSIAADGAILFKPFIKGSGVDVTNDTSFAIASSGGASSVPAREGGPAPVFGFPVSLNFGSDIVLSHPASAPLMSSDGRLAFQTVLQGPGVSAANDRLIYYGTPNSLQVLIREGDQAPGFDPGVGIADQQRGLSNSGDYQVFQTILTGTPLSLRSALYRHQGGSFTVIANSQTSTGIAGVNFESGESIAFYMPQANSSGDVTFSGRFGGTAGHGMYKFEADDAGLKLLAGPTIAAPGTSAAFARGPYSSNQVVSHVLTESGSVAFMYGLTGGGTVSTNDTGIWIHDSHGTRLGIREGDAAGTLSGVTLGTIQNLTFNDNQNLIFISDLVGAVTANDNRAMWQLTPSGDLEMLLRKGDLFDVDPTAGVDNRTISDLLLGGNAPTNFARFGAFSDNNLLSFALTFTDGHSGIFVTDVTPVPEPASLALVGLSAMALLSVRQRHA